METNIHIFEYNDEHNNPLFIRVFVNGGVIHAGSDVSALTLRQLFTRETNFKDIEVWRYSVVPVEEFFTHDHLTYSELRERYPEEAE